MTNAWVFEPRVACVPVTDGRLFPVRRIFCVARNYADHAREMGADPNREAPFFFLKPNDAVFPVTDETACWPYPPMTEEVHLEVELVVALGRGGRNLSVVEAEQAIWGYTVGLDMTRRDLQSAAKAKGRPWDVAKGFDASLPLAPLVPRPGVALTRGAVRLWVNETLRQAGDIAQMIWSIPELIATLSRYWRLAAGDLILTGTPAGVGPVVAGDRVTAEVEGVARFTMTVVADGDAPTR
ncbi:MAG TPA: fumarylacetoacetate hydrolase family protein [Hydrogenophilus thermoluteolus]|nr:fumarylacetoacetate hydrolase family protein [Hydrogenophilus thermoluteolus]